MRNRKHGDAEENESLAVNVLSTYNTKSAAIYLQSLNPDKVGWLEKKSDTCLSSTFPRLFKPWKKRFFILIGNFLFRYGSPESEKPKGVPIPLDSATVSRGYDDLTFEIYTIRKSYTFRSSTKEDCKNWIDCIKTRKQLSIKESMGHAPVNSGIELVNKVGLSLFDERLRRDQQEPARNPMTEYY